MVVRPAASFPPQENNERKRYPLDLIQLPLKSMGKKKNKKSHLLQWKLDQAPSEEKPTDLDQRAKQIPHISNAFL